MATGSLMKVDSPDPQAKEVGEVRPLPLLLQDTLMVIHDGTSTPSSNLSKKSLPRSTGIFRGVFDCLRDLSSCLRDSRPHCRSDRTWKCSSDFNVIFLLGLFVFAASMVQTVSAFVPPSATSTFTIYGLNGNGMVHPVKINHFNSVIGTRRPHVFVVNETKTKTKLGSSLPYSDYDIYEEPGECAEGHHIFKWGVVVGVRKDLQVAQRLEVTQKALKGHRFIGAYALWNKSLSVYHVIVDYSRRL